MFSSTEIIKDRLINCVRDNPGCTFQDIECVFPEYFGLTDWKSSRDVVVDALIDLVRSEYIEPWSHKKGKLTSRKFKKRFQFLSNPNRVEQVVFRIKIDSIEEAHERLKDITFYLSPKIVQLEPSSTSESSSRSQNLEKKVALTFVGLILVTFIILVVSPQKINDLTLAIVRFLGASFAGLAGYLFSGTLKLESKLPVNNTTIKATGGFASFIVVFLLFFYAIPTLD